MSKFIIPQGHPNISSSLLSGADIDKVPDYIRHKLTPREYVQLMSGKIKDIYGLDNEIGVKEAVKDSPHNHEANNTKALSALRDHLEAVNDNNQERANRPPDVISSYQSQRLIGELMDHKLPSS